MSGDLNSAAEIDKLTRQLEMQKVQVELNACFHKNMLLFKEASPSIFEEYVNYQAKNYRLSFTSEGYLTLVNAKTNQPIYAGDPETFTESQLAEYRKSPVCLRLNFLKSGIANPDYIHAPLINELIETYESLDSEEEITVNVPIGFMIIMGCGLGYHIADLVNKHDIYNLLIVEPDKDSFYASLHTIDWRPIITKLTRQYRTIKLCIGGTAEQAFAEIKQLPDEIGLHNLTNTFLYKHLESTKLNHFNNILTKGFHQVATRVGFYDDERISLAHTKMNFSKQTNVLIKSNTKQGSIVIVGNGPSLDEQIDELYKVKDKVTIVSCGTAISALNKYNIKPHFHVEMERTENIYDWIQHGTSYDFRKSITLLTLNTCHPKVTRLFDDVIFAGKPNDLGINYLEYLDHHKQLLELNYCNPTVTNAALSFCINMGYQNIFLWGVDLGFTELSKMHSHQSLYNKFEYRHAPWIKTKKMMTTQGVDGNQINTTVTLDTAKVNLEILMKMHATVQFYNLGSGARINGTKKLEKTQLSEKISSMKKYHHSSTAIKYDKINSNSSDRNLQKKFTKSLKAIIELSRQGNYSFGSIAQSTRIYSHLINNTDKLSKQLYRGSINSILSIITRYTQFSRNDSAIEKGENCFYLFLERSLEIIQEGFFEADKTRSALNEPEPRFTSEKCPASASIVQFNRCGYLAPRKIRRTDEVEKIIDNIEFIKNPINIHKDQDISDLFKSITDDLKTLNIHIGSGIKSSYIEWIPTRNKISPWNKQSAHDPIKKKYNINGAQIIACLVTDKNNHGTFEISIQESHKEHGSVVYKTVQKQIKLQANEYIVIAEGIPFRRLALQSANTPDITLNYTIE